MVEGTEFSEEKIDQMDILENTPSRELQSTVTFNFIM